jgi:hypothetical protein
MKTIMASLQSLKYDLTITARVATNQLWRANADEPGDLEWGKIWDRGENEILFKAALPIREEFICTTELQVGLLT